MFRKTQKAITDLSVAVTEDANQAATLARAAVVPAVASVLGGVADYFNKAKQGVQDGSLFRKVETEAAKPQTTKPAASSVGLTQEQVDAIKALLAVGQSDVVIGATVNVAPEVVTLFRNATA